MEPPAECPYSAETPVALRPPDHRSSVGGLRTYAVHGKTSFILRLSLNVKARLTNHADDARHGLQQVDGALHKGARRR